MVTTKKDVSSGDVRAMLNPVAGAALIGACMVYGVSWLLWAAVMIFLSSMVGLYAESKINEYDAVIRRKAEDVTGNPQPGDARQVGVLVRKANQMLGLFCPAIPLVSLAAGLYIGFRAKRLAKVDTRRAKLARGFNAPGRCAF